jgi:hypothetical protein
MNNGITIPVAERTMDTKNRFHDLLLRAGGNDKATISRGRIIQNAIVMLILFL